MKTVTELIFVIFVFAGAESWHAVNVDQPQSHAGPHTDPTGPADLTNRSPGIHVQVPTIHSQSFLLQLCKEKDTKGSKPFKFWMYYFSKCKKMPFIRCEESTRFTRTEFLTSSFFSPPSLDLLAVSQFLRPPGGASLQSTLPPLPRQRSPVPLSNSSCSRCYRCLQAAAHQYVWFHCLDLWIFVVNLCQSQSNNSTGSTPFTIRVAECCDSISCDFSSLMKTS